MSMSSQVDMSMNIKFDVAMNRGFAEIKKYLERLHGRLLNPK